MDSGQEILIGIFAVSLSALVFCAYKLAESLGIPEEIRTWRWKRAVAKNKEKALDKLSDAAKLIYLGIEGCDDGKLPHSLRHCYSGYEDFATPIEKTALVYARGEAGRRKAHSEVLESAVQGWGDGVTHKADAAQYVAPSIGDLIKRSVHDDRLDAAAKISALQNVAMQMQMQVKDRYDLFQAPSEGMGDK